MNFEYKVVYDLRESDLNELGKKGWDLIAVVPIRGFSSEHFAEFYLKRIK